MAVRRKRPARKPKLPRQAKGTYRGVIAEGDDLAAAAKVIADEASKIAAANRMPETAASISVDSDGKTATVYSDAPAAYPNEVAGVRHPVFGPTVRNPRPPWVTNQHRPFLAPAADTKADDAMKRYAKKLDGMLAKAGFK